MSLVIKRIAGLGIACLLAVSMTGEARQTEPPYSWSHPQTTLDANVPSVVLAPVDQAELLAEDSAAMNDATALRGAAEKRLRVAIGNTIDVNASTTGLWETQADGSRVWRLNVHADHATDLRFGFTRFDVPSGVTLHVVDDARHTYDGAYTREDSSPDRQLWLAPVAGDTLMLELYVPAGAALGSDAVRLTTVATGYRNTTETGGPGLFGAGPSGACNIDVICPLGDPYRNEIRSVAKYYFQEGSSTYLCSGSLINNTAQDFTPYFLTANHCISTQSSATTMSLIWNYESPTCGQHGGGSTSDTQNGGATLIAHRTDVDFSLVELNTTPPSAYHVYYSGWDATGAVPDGSIGIHHPSGWVKAITETAHALTTMNSCIGSGGSQTHWRTGEPYAQGTTEGGSSGSAIFVPAGDVTGHDNLIIGTLSGGSAACAGSVPNNGYDCYGKTSVAWDGTSASQRLKDWLDPGATGATTLGGIDSTGGGTNPNITVSPASISASVAAGASTTVPMTIGNTGGSDLTWTIAEALDTACANPGDVAWLSVSPTGGTTAASGSTPVAAALNSTTLGAGTYTASLCIASNDPDQASTTVPVSFTVNAPVDEIFKDGFDGAGGAYQQPLLDPGFEETSGDAGANPYWAGSDTNDPNGGTPFYSDGFGIPVYEGTYEVWLGGWNGGVAETQIFSQTVAIASGGSRYLNYWRLIDVAPEGSAILKVTIDGNQVASVDLAAAGVDADFVPESIDVSAYADNGSHAVQFRFDHDGNGTDGNTFIDLVTIDESPASIAAGPSSRAAHDPTLTKNR